VSQTDYSEEIIVGSNNSIHFRKRIDKLETSASRNTQIIATMRHEMDILSSHRASLKAIENENVDLKSKLDLMQSIESVLSASQKEVDEILKQKMNAEDLAVMVGTLRRELSNNETRKNELRKQLNSIKNDLRAEQEERKKLQEKLSAYESRNHALMVRLRRFERTENFDVKESSSDIDSPEPSKRPRLALKYLEGFNTPSPLSNVSSIRITLNMHPF
jgi:chromosome segregation ATPase